MRTKPEVGTVVGVRCNNNPDQPGYVEIEQALRMGPDLIFILENPMRENIVFLNIDALVDGRNRIIGYKTSYTDSPGYPHSESYRIREGKIERVE